MQIWKKLITVVTAGGILASQCVAGGLKNIWMAAASAANAAVIYDAADFSTFQDRTLQDVAEAYAEARYAGETYVNGDASTYYTEEPSFSVPYAAGVLTEDTHRTMSAMTDFCRWLIGVNPLKKTLQYSDQMQVGAMVRNYDFNHSVSDENKPNDMSDAFWEYGAACENHILAYNSTPQGAIINFMNEGYSTLSQTWDTVGHRYAMMSMSLSEIQYGYSGKVTIGREISHQNMPKEAFSAFPAPGDMPNALVTGYESAWSVELDTSKITVPDSEKLTVTIENLTTGENWVCSGAEESVKYLYSHSANVVAFVQPSDYDKSYRYTDTYSVRITGLQDAETEQAAEIRYTVNFFDADDYIPSNVQCYETAFSEYVLYTSMDSTENLEKVGAVLDKEIRVRTEAGKVAMVPLAGEWELDEANSCWVNTVDLSALPSNFTDQNGVLQKVVQPYVISDDQFKYYNFFEIAPSELTVGESCMMYVYRVVTSALYSSIFRITENADGSYEGEEKYSSETSPEFDEEASSSETYPIYHAYRISDCTEADSGAYFSVYHDKKYSGRKAYVSTSIETLTVVPEGTTTEPAATTTEMITTTTVSTAQTTTASETAASTVETIETTVKTAVSTAATTKTITTTASFTTANAQNLLFGDVTLDGRIDIADAVLLNKALAGAIKLNTQAFQNADCNANGELDGRDAIALLRFLVHVIDVLPDAA